MQSGICAGRGVVFAFLYLSVVHVLCACASPLSALMICMICSCGLGAPPAPPGRAAPAPAGRLPLLEAGGRATAAAVAATVGAA